jgi:hypothetical protein
MNKENIGSSFDDWLREEDIYEQTTAVAVKRVLARQIDQFHSSENSTSPAKLPAGTM